MGSTRTIVTKRAKLRGMGHEVECIVMGTEVSRPGFPTAYAKLSMHYAPADLPEGPYEVSFSGHKASVRKQSGLFLGAW